MKARPFLTAVGATVLVLLFMATGLWWAMARQSPLRLVDQPLELPRAAQFVPRQAALSLHWLMDPARLPDYGQVVAPPRRRQQARDGVKGLRDGAFALAGLDFETELAGWLGSQVSVTLLDPQGTGDSPGWVLALSSRDQQSARSFLQRFWQTRSLAGTDLQISRYRGMGVISGRGALLGSESRPLATALIDDDLLLLASGRGVLEQALDASQLSDQHQLGDQQLAAEVGRLGDGVALLTASPAALGPWFGLPASITELDGLQGLVAALQLKGSGLGLEAVLSFEEPLVEGQVDPAAGLPLLNSAGGPAEALASFSQPARLLDASDQDPLVQWLGPLLRRQLFAAATASTETDAAAKASSGAKSSGTKPSETKSSGTAFSGTAFSETAFSETASSPAAIFSLGDGPLLWLQQPGGWLLGTQKGHPSIEAVDDALVEQGLVRAELPADGDDLEVWTRLERNSRSGDKLEAQLGLAMAEDMGTAWWGQNLAALNQRQEIKALQPSLDGLRALTDASGDSLANQLVLSAAPARAQLQTWRPWTLIQALAGGSLQTSVQGLAIAVGPDPSIGVDQDGRSAALRLRALFSFG